MIEHVGTLLYGVATAGGPRVWVSNTDARNDRDGLAALENRMFDNRVSYLDCDGACGTPVHVDLDAGAAALGAVGSDALRHRGQRRRRRRSS